MGGIFLKKVNRFLFSGKVVVAGMICIMSILYFLSIRTLEGIDDKLDDYIIINHRKFQGLDREYFIVEDDSHHVYLLECKHDTLNNTGIIPGYTCLHGIVADKK